MGWKKNEFARPIARGSLVCPSQSYQRTRTSREATCPRRFGRPFQSWSGWVGGCAADHHESERHPLPCRGPLARTRSSPEKLYQMLQKVAGRVEKIYTPVEENEISKIIRRRLFSRIDAEGVKKIVNEFVDYAEKEDILPPNVQPSEYRRRFQDSYPFMPEVVDVLYQRWGSFLTFQRTRGALRLLSLVIYDVRESEKPFISLADFNLNHQELRQELLKHIGPEYNGIIANDITGPTSGSKKVDMALGSAYRGLGIGTRTATTIFMYSFSVGPEHGTTLGEIKRSATPLQNP